MDDGAPVTEEVLDRVLVIRLNRPERLNAFDGEMLLHLGRGIRRAEQDPSVGALVLTGAGRAFCAGADLTTTWGPDSALFGLRRRLNPLLLAMAAVEKPLVAALNGPVAGAALGFAGVADVRISARSAFYVPATAALGIAPDGGTSWFVPRLIGPGRAFLWLCGGERIDAGRALDWGLVDLVVDDDELLSRAVATAGALAAPPGAAAALTKRLLRTSAGTTLAEQLELEHRAQEEAARSRPAGHPWAATAAPTTE
jgi:2-(1,2-epoxy-1,2-dihydrophenyl)acetyl-CoA isomerase